MIVTKIAATIAVLSFCGGMVTRPYAFGWGDPVDKFNSWCSLVFLVSVPVTILALIWSVL